MIHPFLTTDSWGFADVIVEPSYAIQRPDKYQDETSVLHPQTSIDIKWIEDLDNDPDVILWKYKPFEVAYADVILNRVEFCSPSFYVMRWVGDYNNCEETVYYMGNFESITFPLVPFDQIHSMPPEARTQYNQSMAIASVTLAKMRAIESHCQKYGMQFKIVTIKNEILMLEPEKKKN